MLRCVSEKMSANIYKLPKAVTQSGCGLDKWVLEYSLDTRQEVEPLMGWTAGREMKETELRLTFDTLNDAIAYASNNNIAYQVVAPKTIKPHIRLYSDNFRYDQRS